MTGLGVASVRKAPAVERTDRIIYKAAS